MSVVDDVKARIDIVDIVSQTVKLRRSGKSYTGFCPFHTNTRTPAFVVFPETGTWRCFSCNEGGDVFGYIMKREGWDFATALKYLADKAGVTLEPATPQKQEENTHLERLRGLLEEAVTFYHHHLLQTSDGEEAHKYLVRRGVLPGTIETFGLGYAPASWDSAIGYFREKGYSEQDLIQAGLATERQGGSGIYDRFRNRLMFPIRDLSGHMAGFGARALAAEDMPKYLNSPQTELFDKGGLLYGLDLARKSIRQNDQVVIVEGYMDMIVPYQAGFTNTVSVMGTALNENQFRLLKRFTRRLVLALDSDSAGEKATLRGLEMARQALDHTADFIPGADGMFDARGLMRQEARLQADLRITTIPAGLDPDEVVLRDPKEWRMILEQAKPVVLHVMETLVASRKLDDPKVKSEIAAQVLPLIEDVSNAIEREEYRQRLARMLHIDERALIGSGEQPLRGAGGQKKRSRRQEQRSSPAAILVDQNAQQLLMALEGHCLKILFQQPETLHSLDRYLQKWELNRLEALDFERTEHQTFIRLIQQSLVQDHFEPNHYLQENIPDLLKGLAQNLLEPFPGDAPTLDRLTEDLIRSVVRLRWLRIKQAIEQMQAFQQDTQEQGESNMAAINELINHYSHVLVKLHQAINQPVQLD